MKKKLSIYGSILVFGLIFGFWIGRSNTAVEKTVTVERVDTVIIADTVREKLPVPEYVYITRIDTVAFVDTVTVTVPITSMTYSTDSYKLTLEGYKPKLLDIELYPKTVYVTKEKETVNTVQVKRTWMPFISASYSTFNIAGVGGGLFYHDIGAEYQFQLDFRNSQSGHLFGLKYKF